MGVCKKHGVIILTLVGMLCTSSNIQSKASSIAFEDTGAISNKVVYINDEEIPTFGGELPSFIDNSVNDYFPPIANQGAIESCSSWAVTYYQASSEFNRIYNLDGSLPENQLSPMWTYNFTNDGKNAGTYFTDVLSVLKNIGCVDMLTVPVDINTGEMEIGNLNASKKNFRKANEKRILKYNEISNGNSNKIDNLTPIIGPKSNSLNEIKLALYEGHILSASTPGNKWIYNIITTNDEVPENDIYAGESIVSRCDKPGYYGHRIAIVGYNDNIWCDINENDIVEEGEMGAFKIANSRGDAYGNDGFMWISYDALNYVSSVCLNSKIDLGGNEREPALSAIISLEIEQKQEEKNYYLEFDVESSNVSEVEVSITAKSKKNNTSKTCEIVPFKHSLQRGLGAVSFDGTRNITKAGFSININKLIKQINVENINDYNWSLYISNYGKSSEKTRFSDIKLVDGVENVVFEGDVESVVLENEEKIILIK